MNKSHSWRYTGYTTFRDRRIRSRGGRVNRYRTSKNLLRSKFDPQWPAEKFLSWCGTFGEPTASLVIMATLRLARSLFSLLRAGVPIEVSRPWLNRLQPYYRPRDEQNHHTCWFCCWPWLWPPTLAVRNPVAREWACAANPVVRDLTIENTFHANSEVAKNRWHHLVICQRKSAKMFKAKKADYWYPVSSFFLRQVVWELGERLRGRAFQSDQLPLPSAADLLSPDHATDCAFLQ